MRTRGVAANSAFALAGDLAGKGGLLAVMMVAARGLPTPEFALFATAAALATVLSAVLDGGSQMLLTRDGVAGAHARARLLTALALARLPLLAACLLVAVAGGFALGRPLEAFGVVALAAAGAAQLTLTGTLRSAQDLRPEAMAKLLSGILQLAGAVICVAAAPSAAALLLLLAGAMMLSNVPLFVAVRRQTSRSGPPASRFATLRRAVPLGVMALATLAYYRSGTIVLSWLSTPAQTARFATASTVAWGMLCVGNAVTTGLLPRLSAAAPEDRDAILVRSLKWLTGFSTVMALGVVVLARPMLTVIFGARYATAAPTLDILVVATALIAPAGVIGTGLVAQRRLRPVAVQVALSLSINLVVLIALAPVLGAPGAALATLACEGVGLGVLVAAVCRPRIGRSPARFALAATPTAGALARSGR